MVRVKKGARVLRVPESALHVYLHDGYAVVPDDASQEPNRMPAAAVEYEMPKSRRRKR